MGIGTVGIDANESEEIIIQTEITNVEEVVNFYFEIRKYLFPSQPTQSECDFIVSNIKTQTPPIPIPPPNYP